jgi:hypothetical protein
MDAVNALSPLGTDGALEAIEAYLGRQDLDSDPKVGLFLVLRVLFEVPVDPGYHPPLRLGAATPPPPSDLKSLPLYPIVLVDDRPLMLVSGYALGGDTEPVAAHVEFYRAHGKTRASPLAPAGARDSVFDHFEATWRRAYGIPPSKPVADFVTAQLTE